MQWAAHDVNYNKHETKDNKPRISKLCAIIPCDKISSCCVANLTIFLTLSRAFLLNLDQI